jgi:hypothetical protein
VFKKIIQKRETWLEPAFYLAICVFAFGLFIPVLGFYWDDWPTIFYTHSGRAVQLVNHFSYDRPFSVWGYWLIGRLGTSPFTWHIAAMLIRWMIVVAFAWAIKPLWPKQTKTITLIALLFAIYPGYYLQPSSVIFASHLLALLFFLISLGAMARAVTDQKNKLRYSILAIGATIVHMSTLEYFVGLELVRPLYLWFLLQNTGEPKRDHLKQLFKSWIPNLIVALSWVFWRLFLLKLPSEPYPLVLGQVFKANPLQGLIQLVTIALQDVFYVLVTAWTEIWQPAFFQLTSAIDILIWLVVVASFAMVYFVLKVLNTGKTRSKSGDVEVAKQGIALGVVALIAGLIPVWMIGERIAQGDYNLRYILVAMFGAALVVGGLIVFFVRERKYQVLIVSAMVALTIGMHLRAANDYRLDWEKQRAFYWQLYWRAPNIEQGTALISFDRPTKYLGDPMTGNALNVLYPLESEPPFVDLWNFELNRTLTVEAIQNGDALSSDYRGLKFNTQSPRSLVFYFVPQNGCLWLLDPENIENQYLPYENRDLVAFSNLARLSSTAETSTYPDPVVFGNEPQHDWCYYFERADLARQFGNWEQVIALLDEAADHGLSPTLGIEWLPLVEAYAVSGDWTSAAELSQEIHYMDTRNDSMVCATWKSVFVGMDQVDEEATAAYQQISTMAACK